MRKPVGGWPLVIIVSVAVAVTLLTFVFLNRTTYKPGRDNMAPPTSRHTHKLLERVEKTPSSLGLHVRWELR